MESPITAWVAFLDIYGFRNRLASSKSLSELVRSLTDLKGRALIQARRPVSRTIFFSDAIVLVQESTDDLDKGFSDLEVLIRHLCVEGTRLDLPLRGSVAYGEVIVREYFCVGQPLIDAYDFEQQLLIPIVVLPERVCAAAGVPIPKKMRPIPTKEGIASGFPILPIPSEEFLALSRRRLIATLRDGPPRVASVWDQTIKFCQEHIKEMANEG